MDMIKYLVDYEVEDVSIFDDYSRNEMRDFVINHKNSEQMSLAVFESRFNAGDIDDVGFIAFVPPLSYVDKAINKIKRKKK